MIPNQPPAAHVRHERSIALQAERLSRLPLAQAHAICDAEIARAVRDWRISDATEWQRVRFRVRWIHALRARAAGKAEA